MYFSPWKSFNEDKIMLATPEKTVYTILMVDNKYDTNKIFFCDECYDNIEECYEHDWIANIYPGKDYKVQILSMPFFEYLKRHYKYCPPINPVCTEDRKEFTHKWLKYHNIEENNLKYAKLDNTNVKCVKTLHIKCPQKKYKKTVFNYNNTDNENPSSKNKISEITEKLEKGISEMFKYKRYKEYLDTVAKFHNYSFRNTVLISMQKPNATFVAGYKAWIKNFNRYVMKGERGIKILAPCPEKITVVREKIDPETKKPILDENGFPVMEKIEETRLSFRVATVFDVSQTAGEELPSIVNRKTSGVNNYSAFFNALKEVSPIPIQNNNCNIIEEKSIMKALRDIAYSMLPDVKLSSQKPMWKIVMSSGHGYKQDFMSGFETEEQANEAAERENWQFVDENDFVWALLVEEDDDMVFENINVNNAQAECVAYCACKHFGIDISDISFGFIEKWCQNREANDLKMFLETIKNTASNLISAVEEIFFEQKQDEDITEVYDDIDEEICMSM